MTRHHLSATELEIIKSVLQGACDVRLFGSRIKGTAHPYSDLDLCICDNPSPSDTQMQLWREAFEESRLPFMVDLSRWNDLPEFLQETIATEGVKLNDCR